jgi:thiol-disulfide isomerase/thioredoxin
MNEDNSLDELLGQSTDTFLINFWEHCTPACSIMNQVMIELEDFLEKEKVALSILRLNLIENRNWAKKYKLQGTPSILIVRNKEVIATIRGKISISELLKQLIDLGIIDE